jgi:hypothetical protein
MLVLLAGCGVEDDECAGVRDLTHSAAGLELTAEEHPAGWGRPACFQCHPAWTVHNADCIEGVAVDVEALEAEDCVACHGTNGVGR